MEKNSGSIIQALNMNGNPPPQPTPEAPLGPVASAGNNVARDGGAVNPTQKRADAVATTEKPVYNNIKTAPKEGMNHGNLTEGRGGDQAIPSGASEKNANRPAIQGGVRENQQNAGREAEGVPARGLSVAEDEARTLAEYRIKSHIVNQREWTRKEPAYSVDGEVYLSSEIPEDERGMIGVHEATHVMKEVGYPPYLNFIDRMKRVMNIQSASYKVLQDYVAKRRGIDLSNMTKEDVIKLYDEINAMFYGHIASGKFQKAGVDVQTFAHDVFFDFDSYAEELRSIHEQFKRGRSGGEGAAQPPTLYDIASAMYTGESDRLYRQLRLQHNARGGPMPPAPGMPDMARDDSGPMNADPRSDGQAEPELPVDYLSILDLGYGPVSASKLRELIELGEVEQYVEDGRIRFRRANRTE